MTAVATDSRRATTSVPPVRRRPRGIAVSTSASPARPGGMVLWGVIALAVVAAVGVVGSGGGYGADVATAAGESTTAAAGGEWTAADAAVTVTLGEGETAWEALKPHTPDGVRHEVFVHEVVRANGVDARELRPGDVLVVPGEDG